MCHKFGPFTTVCYQKNQQTSSSFKPRKPKAHQLWAGTLYTYQDGDSNVSEESNTDESFCLQMKVQKTQLKNQQLPTPVYLMTNLVYHLKIHHKLNQYLCVLTIGFAIGVNYIILEWQLVLCYRFLSKTIQS